MTQPEHGEAVAERHSDAFGPVTLANFATNPAGAHLFRVQHEHLSRLMTTILADTEVEVNSVGAVGARSALTTLSVLLPLHQSLEDSLLHRALAQEPRVRMVVDQFEREVVPLLAELAALARRYPSASAIATAPKGEFAHLASALFGRLQERFRREERDLFPAYDRTTRAGAVAGPVAA